MVHESFTLSILTNRAFIPNRNSTSLFYEGRKSKLEISRQWKLPWDWREKQTREVTKRRRCCGIIIFLVFCAEAALLVTTGRSQAVLHPQSIVILVSLDSSSPSLSWFCLRGIHICDKPTLLLFYFIIQIKIQRSLPKGKTIIPLWPTTTRTIKCRILFSCKTRGVLTPLFIVYPTTTTKTRNDGGPCSTFQAPWKTMTIHQRTAIMRIQQRQQSGYFQSLWH